MNFAHERLAGLDFEEKTQIYSEKDTIFYGLCAGYGSDPLDPAQLRYVFERELQALPAMVHVLAMDGGWLGDPANGIDLTRMLHGDTGMQLHKPLPPSGEISSRAEITGIIDKGPGKGALVLFRRNMFDATGEALATTEDTFFLRGDGGFGGSPGPLPVIAQLPSRGPDTICDLATLPQAALLYRLTGDTNPLHADPAVAARAGFERPILHGACTNAMACRALVHLLCDDDPARLQAMHARFSAPMFPGETLRTEVWREEESRFLFRCLSVERNVVVLNNGTGALWTAN